MEALTNPARELLSLVGPLWPIVWIAGFVVMMFESARPKVNGQDVEPSSAWARLGMLAIAALPFLLFLHAFGAFILANQNSGVIDGEGMLPIVVLVAAIGVLVFVPALLGALVTRLSPSLGRVLNRAAPLLGIATLVFAAYVTWSNVFMVLDLYVLRRLS